MFETVFLVYKFLHSDYPEYVVPRHSVYNKCKSQAYGVFIEVPQFATSVYKYSKHFGLSFAYDAHSERCSKPISLNKHIQHNFCFYWFLSMVLKVIMSQVNDYSFLLSLFGASGVCL